MEIATEATEATEQVPIIIYRNIETRDKYNHSDKGRECRKRYLDKNSQEKKTYCLFKICRELKIYFNRIVT